MRRFKMTDKFIGNITLRVINYRWTPGKGLECELFAGLWYKSEYNLKEFLAGMNGNWDIYADARDYCASIPTTEAAKQRGRYDK